MHYKEDVDIFFCSKSSKLCCDSVLQVKLLVAFSLVAEHELHVVDAYHADVIVVDGGPQGFEDLLNRG